MRQPKIDKSKLMELHHDGLSGPQIARKFGVSNAAIYKALERFGLAITKAAIRKKLPAKFAAKKANASEVLTGLVEKAQNELLWIEQQVKPATNGEYRAWQDQKLKFAGEMRKLIHEIADIGYKLFQAKEVSEVLKIIDEEIGLESPECQRRIRERLERRRNIRIPLNLH